MKKSCVLIIFLSFILLADFAGAVVYRNLVNDNSRKDVGPENYNLNEEQTKNGSEDFDRQGGKIDLPGAGNVTITNQDEEQGDTEVGKEKACRQLDVGQEGSGEKAGVVSEKVKESFTCGEQGEKGGAEEGQNDNRQETDNQKDDLDNATEENGGQSYIENAAGDDKIGAENEEAESKQSEREVGVSSGKNENAETTYGTSDEKGVVSGEPDTARSTEIKANGEQNESAKNESKAVDTVVQTIRFSPLDR